MPHLDDHDDPVTTMSGGTGGGFGRYKELVQDAKEQAFRLLYKAQDFWYRLSTIKKIALILLGCCVATSGVILLIYHDEFFKFLVAFSKKWKEMPGGGALMFFMIVLISFPPLIGYSALSSIVGMMYGFPWGWPFLTIATIVGSTLSFLTFRYLLSNYANRMASSNTKFAALTNTIEQDKFTLLWMIRLCPLPYSLSNGALSTIPAISAKNFAIATALTSPKLMMHIFIGDRMARIGTEKDTATKVVDIASIVIAGTIGTATAYIIYNRTMERARHLEAELDDYSQLDDDAREFELESDSD